MKEEVFGTGGTVTNGLLATILFTKMNATNFVTTADFSPMGSTNMNVQTLNNGQSEFSVSEANGVVFAASLAPRDFGVAMNTGEIYASYIPYVFVNLTNHEDVAATAVGMTPNVAPPLINVTSVELLVGGIPQIIITNESRTVLYGGVLHASRGNATFSLQSNQLTVGNLNVSGQDGVAVALPAVTNWQANREPLDPNGMLPVGAYLQIQEIGTANGVTNGLRAERGLFSHGGDEHHRAVI